MTGKSRRTLEAETAVRSYAECARLLGVSEAAVRQAEYRAIRKLRIAICARVQLPEDERDMDFGEWLRWHCGYYDPVSCRG